MQWTPIGNGEHSFSGFFDGNGKTVKNLKVTVGASYMYSPTGNTGSDAKEYVSGLFGSCAACEISSVGIDGAVLEISGITDIEYIYAGTLCGGIRSDGRVILSDIKISNSKITLSFEQEKEPNGVAVGGAVGYFLSTDSVAAGFYRIQADVDVSLENSSAKSYYVGGLLGTAGMINGCDVNNCRSDLSVKIDNENCHQSDNRFGAFGSLSSSNVSNMFSTVTVDKKYDTFHFYPAYYANVIAGYVFMHPEGYKLENVFGCVRQIDEITGERDTTYKLYNSPEGTQADETNCKGCEVLPPDSGFDPSIWDLSDLSDPKLK